VRKIYKAIESRDKYFEIQENSEVKINPGGKSSLDNNSYRSARPLVESWYDAAEVINNLQPVKNITIASPGGTDFNKMNAYIAGRGQNLSINMVTFYGYDKYGKIAEKDLAKRSLNLVSFDSSAEETQLNFIINDTRDGVKLKDRDVHKGTSTNEKELFEKHHKQIFDELQKADRICLEGASISENKIGHKLFKEIVDFAISKDKDLVVSACTNKNVLDEHPHNRSILQTGYRYAGNDLPTTMNVGELIDNYLPKDLQKNIPENRSVKITEDIYVRAALSYIQKELQIRESSARQISLKDRKKIFNKPCALVSHGGEGAFILDSKNIIFLEADKGLKIVSTLGAGDNMTAGSWTALVKLANDFRSDNTTEKHDLTKEDLVVIGEVAKLFAKHAITQLHAAINQDIVRSELKVKFKELRNLRLEGRLLDLAEVVESSPPIQGNLRENLDVMNNLYKNDGLKK